MSVNGWAVLLVVREIAADRRRARSLLAPQLPPKRPERSYPAPLAPSMSPPFHLGPAFAVSPGDVMRYVQEIEASLGNVLIGMRKAVDTELDSSVQMLWDEVTAGDKLLRDNLRELLVGGIRDRTIGAGLVAVGIVLGTVGSILGNLA
jgi:hypothetical protein